MVHNMDNKMLTLGILTLVSILGIIIFQMNVHGDPFLVGLGFTISSIGVLIAVLLAELLPNIQN